MKIKSRSVKACDERPADLSSIMCSSRADVAMSVAPSSREMKPFGAFVIVISTLLLLPAPEVPCEKDMLVYWVGFWGFCPCLHTQ